MAKPRDLSQPTTRVVAWEFRTPVRSTTLAIIGTTFAAWVVSFFLFTYGTDLGRSQLDTSGFLAIFVSWLIIAALVCGGYGLGYIVLRKVSTGQRPFAERELLKLALAESFSATCGGFAVGFLPITLMSNMFTMFLWTFAIGFLFSFVVIMPRYTKAWQQAVVDGRAYEG
ncbi:hypothetical protein [Gulosibacter molinativorax]|uniref:Uncharacterized protein n=1 Tax=Gulosibacter molinativorax TaxID=256821 RepID=A0ABT7C5G0_9MICO|nr:hypothetical protein [Gulosibacter molinativorax]MDJ1370432.1 hypothetical protein [Gulosibacter molinativorax]QUY61345.1 Hypotetical protein [Gulosibacter molinativorax]